MPEGMKFDSKKLRYSLLPWDALTEVVKVLDYGANKYAVGNWEKVPEARVRYFDAALRHLLAWRGGETRDPESGHYHLAHAVCCVLFLLAFTVRRRFPRSSSKSLRKKAR
jgi:hypothetical protein